MLQWLDARSELAQALEAHDAAVARQAAQQTEERHAMELLLAELAAQRVPRADLEADTLPVLLERAIPIGLLENAQQLGERLATLTAELLVEAMPPIEAAGPGHESERWERLQVRPQGDSGLTYARLISKDDYGVDWQQSALAIHRQVMGLYPGAHTSWRGERLKLLATEPLVERLADQLSPEGAALCGRWPTGGGGTEAGTVLACEPGVGLVIATGGCPLLLRSGQLAGKRSSEGQALLQQLEARAGDQLGR
jgi:methionyl-tRNA formyltransferase